MSRLRPVASLAARLATPLAALLAIAAFARLQKDPVAAAEASYLALAVGLALLAAAGVAPRPSGETVSGALLATVAVWALPAGPARGALAVAIAAGALAVAVARWFPLGDPSAGAASNGAPRRPEAPDEGRLPVVPALALAGGLQALLRAPDLLAPGGVLHALALFVAFPAAGAAAVMALALWHGRRRALLAGAAVLLVGPGFRPATLAALLAMAAASWLVAREPLAAVLRTDGTRSPLDALGPRGRAGVALVVRLAALGILVAPFAWDAATATACTVAAVAAARPGARHRWAAWAPPALAAVGVAVALALPGRPLAEALPLAAIVLMAVPALALPERDRTPAVLAALLLAVAAARGIGVEGALAPAAGLAGLAAGRRGVVAAAQGGWAATLLGATCLLAAYPWLREAPLSDALALVGLEPAWPVALAACVAAALAATLSAVLARRSEPTAYRPASDGSGARGAALAGVAALALALLHLPTAGAMPVEETALTLTGDRPSWSVGAAALGPERPPGARPRVGAIVVDSALANAAALPDGTPVATLRLREAGRPDRVWTLRAGRETGEWAAGRPDLQAEQVPAPSPWTSWVADGGEFFGRRYRATRRLEQPATPERLELALRRDLPDDVELTVFHLELRP